MCNFELFSSEEMAADSPRLAWMRRHGFWVRRFEDLQCSGLVGTDFPVLSDFWWGRDAVAGVTFPVAGQWVAWMGIYRGAAFDTFEMDGCYPAASRVLVWAGSEEGALMRLAMRRGVESWLSEGGLV
jgi:hypothetical protein